MKHDERVETNVLAALVEHPLEWSNIGFKAIDIANVRGGVRVELSALRYNEVVDLINRERRSSGDWLELDLTRQDGLLLLNATARTDQGRSAIRSMIGSGSFAIAS